jgi:hypothetical protein
MKKIKFILPGIVMLFASLLVSDLTGAIPFAEPCENCGQDGEWQGYYPNGYDYAWGAWCKAEDGTTCARAQICMLNGSLSDCFQVLCLDCNQPIED